MYAHAPKETHKWTEPCKPRFDHFMCIVSVLDLILPLSHCGQQNLHFNVNHREKTAISSFTLLVLLVTGWGSLINPKFMWILYFLLFWIFSCQIPLVGLYRIKRWRKTSLKCECIHLFAVRRFAAGSWIRAHTMHQGCHIKCECFFPEWFNYSLL